MNGANCVQSIAKMRIQSAEGNLQVAFDNNNLQQAEEDFYLQIIDNDINFHQSSSDHENLQKIVENKNIHLQFADVCGHGNENRAIDVSYII